MDILVLFLTTEDMLSVFHHWEWCFLWVCYIWPLLCWGRFPPCPLYREFFSFSSLMGIEFCQKLFLHLLRWSYGFYSVNIYHIDLQINGNSLHAIGCFSLVLIFFSLSLIFVNLINICLSVLPFEFILYGTLCFLDLCFLSHVREVFSYNIFKYF